MPEKRTIKVFIASPGASALFKVYVTLSTGNEKGSNVSRITRPG